MKGLVQQLRPRTAVTMASSTAFVLISAASDDDDDR